MYLYTCGQCGAQYYGQTMRHLRTRIAEHRGLSSRTGHAISNPTKSAIRDHALHKGHDIQTQNFSLKYSSDAFNLKLAESILIFDNKPSLNNTEFSEALNILG